MEQFNGFISSLQEVCKKGLAGASKRIWSTRPFGIEELKRFFATFRDDREGRRDRLFFLAQFYLGARRNTINTLNLYNIMWKDKIYYIRGDKGFNYYSNNGERALPMAHELFYHLSRQCEDDLERIKMHSGFIFYSDCSDVPSAGKYQKLFRKHVRMAGLDRIYKFDAKEEPRFDLVTHSFRKTYATYLLENGCELPTLMALLGHTTMLSTHKYLRLSTRIKKNIVSRIFDGKVIRQALKPLILCEDTPYIEEDESIVNISITKEQLDLLVKLGIINSETNMATMI